MGINLVVAVTDDDWFEMLRWHQNLSEVNFWAPSAANFRALQPGEMFLFKLHAPRNVIVGGGYSPRHYYAYQGQRISAPEAIGRCPDPAALTWHNEHCFKG